jgi:hypothetical protein
MLPLRRDDGSMRGSGQGLEGLSRAARRDAEQSAHHQHRIDGRVGHHESEERFRIAMFSRANQAAAFERISRISCFTHALPQPWWCYSWKTSQAEVGPGTMTPFNPRASCGRTTWITRASPPHTFQRPATGSLLIVFGGLEYIRIRLFRSPRKPIQPIKVTCP